eukprot:scaffold2706_cov109-Isochrysis_galbana.AAC.5
MMIDMIMYNIYPIYILRSRANEEPLAPPPRDLSTQRTHKPPPAPPSRPRPTAAGGFAQTSKQTRYTAGSWRLAAGAGVGMLSCGGQLRAGPGPRNWLFPALPSPGRSPCPRRRYHICPSTLLVAIGLGRCGAYGKFTPRLGSLLKLLFYGTAQPSTLPLSGGVARVADLGSPAAWRAAGWTVPGWGNQHAAALGTAITSVTSGCSAANWAHDKPITAALNKPNGWPRAAAVVGTTARCAPCASLHTASCASNSGGCSSDAATMARIPPRRRARVTDLRPTITPGRL